MNGLKISITQPYWDMWIVSVSRNGRRVAYREARSHAEAKRIAASYGKRG